MTIIQINFSLDQDLILPFVFSKYYLHFIDNGPIIINNIILYTTLYADQKQILKNIPDKG